MYKRQPIISDWDGFAFTPLIDNGTLYSQYPIESVKSVTAEEINVTLPSLFILIKCIGNVLEQLKLDYTINPFSTSDFF